MGHIILLKTVLMTTVLLGAFSFSTFAVAQNCETLFSASAKAATAQPSKLELALERSDYLIEAIVQDRLGYAPNTMLTVELSQNFSHSVRPSISDYELTHLAQALLIGKFQTRHPNRNPKLLPQITKMWFDETPTNFKSVDATLRSRLLVNVWVSDLAELITTFAESAHHPALGNQVFKISLVHNP